MEIYEKLNKDNETLETNKQELSDEKLEQVTGGSKIGDPIFDEVTTILIKWRDCVILTDYAIYIDFLIFLMLFQHNVKN